MKQDKSANRRGEPPRRWMRRLERGLFISGALLLALFSIASVDRWVSSRLALQAFDRVYAAQIPQPGVLAGAGASDDGVDFSLWSEGRIQAYRDVLITRMEPPMGVLEVAELGIRVPVFEGVDEVVLNRGVGWIQGTARPGDSGNIGLAGHRDSFFRVLKDMSIDEVIQLTSGDGTRTYVVDEMRIVEPEDVEVLLPREKDSITLVTCYPFYFVGAAPQRFIVHASVTEVSLIDSKNNPSASVDAGANSLQKENEL